MIKKKTFRSILEVTASNITTIIAGVVVGFIVPKIFSLNDYGYFKTFTLYTTYIGLFNLGIADGIVLKYGGMNYVELDKKTFRGYFKWYLLVHLFFAVLMVAVGVGLFQGNLRFLIMALALDTIVVNSAGFFQQISQITRRFKEYSMRKILQSFCNILVALILFAIYKYRGKVGYQIYIVLGLFVNTLLALWYFSTYRDIILGDSKSLKDTKSDIINLIRIGFPLLFANLCSTLILSLDRQFVNILFSTSTYAVYAFAYNMLQLVTVATSAIATVLYPTLKRTTVENLKESYTLLSSTILIFVFGAMLIYFPLCLFVNWFLPKYTEALRIFRIVFPGLAISSSITVVMHNYYKVLGNNFIYFKKSLITLVISGIANGIAYWKIGTPSSISIASIITMIFWYIYVEQYFVKHFQINPGNNMLYLTAMGAGFYLITIIHNYVFSGIMYLAFFIIVTLTFKKKDLCNFRKFI